MMKQTAVMKLPSVRKVLQLTTYASYAEIRRIVEASYADSALARARAALRKIRSAHVLRRDPYLASGYSPTENQISNALKLILDPSSVEGIGPVGLRALLASARDSSERSAQKLDAIGRRIEEGGSPIYVRRETSIDDGRIDIRISDEMTFLIIVENKRYRDTTEFALQTRRYENELTKADEAGRITVGIYLTPDGKRPLSRAFIPVSCERFSNRLCEQLSRVQMPDESTRTLWQAFALTYAWIH